MTVCCVTCSLSPHDWCPVYTTHTACCQEHRNLPTKKPKPHKVKPAKLTLKSPRALVKKPKVKASPASPVQTALTQVLNAACHKCLQREREAHLSICPKHRCSTEGGSGRWETPSACHPETPWSWDAEANRSSGASQHCWKRITTAG